MVVTQWPDNSVTHNTLQELSAEGGFGRFSRNGKANSIADYRLYHWRRGVNLSNPEIMLLRIEGCRMITNRLGRLTAALQGRTEQVLYFLFSFARERNL